MAEGGAEVVFKHKTNLFTRQCRPMQFSMRPGPARRQIKPLIEHGGGKISSQYIEKADIIRLAPAGSVVDIEDTFSTDFILHSVAADKLLDMEKFRLPVSKHNVATRHSSVTDDCVTSPRRPRRKEFSAEDDLAILRYIQKTSSVTKVKGNDLWKEMEARRVTNHPWQGMRNRLLRTVAYNLDSYNLQPHFKTELASFLGVADRGSKRLKTLRMRKDIARHDNNGTVAAVPSTSRQDIIGNETATAASGVIVHRSARESSRNTRRGGKYNGTIKRRNLVVEDDDDDDDSGMEKETAAMGVSAHPSAREAKRNLKQMGTINRRDLVVDDDVDDSGTEKETAARGVSAHPSTREAKRNIKQMGTIKRRNLVVDDDVDDSGTEKETAAMGVSAHPSAREAKRNLKQMGTIKRRNLVVDDDDDDSGTEKETAARAVRAHPSTREVKRNIKQGGIIKRQHVVEDDGDDDDDDISIVAVVPKTTSTARASPTTSITLKQDAASKETVVATKRFALEPVRELRHTVSAPRVTGKKARISDDETGSSGASSAASKNGGRKRKHAMRRLNPKHQAALKPSIQQLTFVNESTRPVGQRDSSVSEDEIADETSSSSGENTLLDARMPAAEESDVPLCNPSPIHRPQIRRDVPSCSSSPVYSTLADQWPIHRRNAPQSPHHEMEDLPMDEIIEGSSASDEDSMTANCGSLSDYDEFDSDEPVAWGTRQATDGILRQNECVQMRETRLTARDSPDSGNSQVSVLKPDVVNKIATTERTRLGAVLRQLNDAYSEWTNDEDQDGDPPGVAQVNGHGPCATLVNSRGPCATLVASRSSYDAPVGLQLPTSPRLPSTASETYWTVKPDADTRSTPRSCNRKTVATQTESRLEYKGGSAGVSEAAGQVSTCQIACVDNTLNIYFGGLTLTLTHDLLKKYEMISKVDDRNGSRCTCKSESREIFEWIANGLNVPLENISCIVQSPNSHP